MITTLRSLMLPAFLFIAGTLPAQNQYTVTITGHVYPCTPSIADGLVTITSVQGTQPSITITAPLNANCSYSVTLPMESASGWFQASASCMNGAIGSNSGQYQINVLGGADTLLLDLNCGTLQADCEGVPNGPAMPGTPCVDGDPNTINDVWSANCECIGVQGDCTASFTLSQVAPFTMAITNLSTAPFGATYSWGMPLGSTSNDFEPADVTFPQTNDYQVYGICLEITGPNCASWMCDTILVDPNGGLSFDPVYFDCEGVVNGPAVPGSPCDDGDPATEDDHWTANCTCEGTDPNATYTVTIQGHMEPCTPATQGGWVLIQSFGIQPAITDTVQMNANCFYTYTTTVNSPTGVFMVTASCGNGTVDQADGAYTINANGGSATLTLNLVCNGLLLDCQGVPNGPAIPGTPCDDGDPNTTGDHWTANCECIGTEIGTEECEAGFWVVQAHDGGPNGTGDPIPYELWVWNLSTSNAPVIEYVWDFGDGTTSTEAFPTHVYDGSGPYVLCLTIYTSNGCTDAYCDTISVDEDGMFQGIMGGGDDRSVLTIHVHQGLSTGVAETRPNDVLAWPNPASDLLNLELGRTITGQTRVSILDVDGRLLRTLDRRLSEHAGRLVIPVVDLQRGAYMIRIDNAGGTMTYRFIKE